MTSGPSICVIGDVHGHLQLALCMAARWQEELKVAFEAVLLCGDVGTFTADEQLDSTTRRHAKTNPCELEFLHQWSVTPQPPWLSSIFAPRESKGLGLDCPVVMVHGNHEGFTHLARILPDKLPSEPIAISDLPIADSAGYIRYLPSGWTCLTASNVVVGGVGGIERGQRRADYHELAYLDELAILNLVENGPCDILITHQGPGMVQGDHGSSLLDGLLEAETSRYWFHGHSTPNPEIKPYGPRGRTTVIPLGDAAFRAKGPSAGDPGRDAWCWIAPHEEGRIRRERPAFWREYRMRKWKMVGGGQLVAPPLADGV